MCMGMHSIRLLLFAYVDPNTPSTLGHVDHKLHAAFFGLTCNKYLAIKPYVHGGNKVVHDAKLAHAIQTQKMGRWISRSGIVVTDPGALLWMQFIVMHVEYRTNKAPFWDSLEGNARDALRVPRRHAHAYADRKSVV